MVLDFSINASEVLDFAADMGGSEAIIGQGIADGTNVLVVEGIGFAVEFAPRGKTGDLAGSIQVIKQASAGDPTGIYGTSLVYAWQREEGGTITGNPWLVFQVDGHWVKVRSVTQEGDHYMRQSVEALEGRVDQVYGAAIDAALGRL